MIQLRTQLLHFCIRITERSGTQAHLTLLCFADIVFFSQIEGLWQHCVEQVYRRPFLTAFVHLVSVTFW